METDLLIKDKGDLALWNRTAVMHTYIPIENFEDPLYIVETRGLVTNQINKTPYSVFVQGGNYSNLFSHVQNSYYINSTLAPSFLDRLKGDIDNENPNGIESLVYLPKLSLQGIPGKRKSCVDYIYFSTNNPSYSAFPAVYSDFRIDNEHKSVYGLL